MRGLDAWYVGCEVNAWYMLGCPWVGVFEKYKVVMHTRRVGKSRGEWHSRGNTPHLTTQAPYLVLAAAPHHCPP